MQIRKCLEGKNLASKRELERNDQLRETVLSDIALIASDKLAGLRKCECNLKPCQGRVGLCDDCHLNIAEETEVCMLGDEKAPEQTGSPNDLKESIEVLDELFETSENVK
jgi:hypothetical protein